MRIISHFVFTGIQIDVLFLIRCWVMASTQPPPPSAAHPSSNSLMFLINYPQCLTLGHSIQLCPLSKTEPRGFWVMNMDSGPAWVKDLFLPSLPPLHWSQHLHTCPPPSKSRPPNWFQSLRRGIPHVRSAVLCCVFVNGRCWLEQVRKQGA